MAGRVLLFAGAGRSGELATFEAQLRQAGRAVVAAEQLEHALLLVQAFGPDVVVAIGRPTPTMMGLLRAHGALQQVPLVVIEDVGPNEILSLLHDGVSRVVPRQSPAAWESAWLAGVRDPLVVRGLAAFQATLFSGRLQVIDGSQLVGDIAMVDGKLTQARCGELSAQAALQALCVMNSANLRMQLPRLPSLDLDIEAVQLSMPATPQPLPTTRTPVGGRMTTDELLNLAPASVLVVEDDQDLQKLYVRLLQHRGFTVWSADDGAAGYDIARARKPDAILSDIMMPRVNGWDLLALIRNDAEVRETRVVLLSHHRDLLGSLAGVQAGADDYIEKTASRDEIVARVSKVLLGRREFTAACRGAPGLLEGKLSLLSPAYVLGALSGGQRTGRLTVQDAWGAIEVDMINGNIARVITNAAGTPITGDDALRSLLLLDDGQLRFVPITTPTAPVPARNTMEWVVAMQQSLNSLLEQSRGATLLGGKPLAVQHRLMDLYLSTAPEATHAIALALRGGQPPTTLLMDGHSPMLVDFVVRDLLRKGIVAPA
jgi:DNA-binding response OmpR family regulator